MVERTVRELQLELLRLAGLDPLGIDSIGEYILDRRREILWREISGLWIKKGLDPAIVPNLDTAISLTREEFQSYVQRASEIEQQILSEEIGTEVRA